MLMFSTNENLDRLVQTSDIYADGTFSSAPIMFYQVYTIHAIFDGFVTPLVFCLLTNKKRSTYCKLLQKLKELRPALNPKSIMIDYEKAQIHAFQSVFKDITIRGCFFHLNQAFFR